MAGLVQASTLSNTNGLTDSRTLTGVTPGNALYLMFIHTNQSNTGEVLSCSDGTNSYSPDVNSVRGAAHSTGVFRLFNAPGGSNTVTITSAAGTAGNNFFRCILLEFNGIVSLDKVGVANNASSTGPLIATTSGNLTQNIELLLACAYSENGVSGFTTPAGFTNLAAGSTLNFAYQLTTLAAGAPASANFGSLSSAAPWDVGIGSYVTSAPVPFPPMSLGGIGVQMCQ